MSRLVASPRASKFLIVFVAAGLLFEFGAFRRQLSGVDPGLPVDGAAASIIVQILTASAIVAAGALVLCSRRASDMALGTWPIFVMPALAFASMLWSPDAEVTVRKSVAFFGTVLFGFSVATVLSTKDAIRLLGRVLSLATLFSVAWLYLFPYYAIHNSSDYAGNLLEGDWRGIFAHRTVLGHVAGLTMGLLICYGRLIWSSRLFRYGIVALSVACVIGADSGGGILTAAFVPLALVVTQAVIRLKPAHRGAVLVLMLVTILLLMVLAPKLLSTGLFLLNKQPDLTGRVPLWDTILVMAQEQPLLGYGYFAGFVQLVQPQVLAATGNIYAHCHNGYLEVLIAFGYFGLGICLAVIIWLLRATGRLVAAPPAHLGHLSGFPLTIVIYVLGANCIESMLITESNYAVVLLALAAGLATRARLEARELSARTAAFRRGVDHA
ncbi:O-antigen ligase family protein [Bradyrhizobium sp. JYMT SZCCT0180]|uniref:O-antigen ligase family protein n=1 Tax=Bradyrhizobium sp. JYMT SZCCT0180 TaxID=2807666 RepID=UPI001BA43E98|nr:O-antigen ligase family protein [Bradyrhizobium sp. JYMT SZCCT0180]